MKWILWALLLLLPTAGPLSAGHAPRPTRHHTAAAQTVYLCDNGRTVVYHSSTDCPAMGRCTHPVRALSVREAKASGHRECMKCY